MASWTTFAASAPRIADGTRVGEGDAKLRGTVEDVPDDALHHRYAEDPYQRSGFDLRGQTFTDFFRVQVVGASSVEVIDGHLDITVWHQDGAERVVRKH